MKPPASFATSSSSSSSGGGEEAAAAGAKPPSQKQKQRLAKKKRKHKYYGPTPNEYHGETSQFCEVRFWKNEGMNFLYLRKENIVGKSSWKFPFILIFVIFLLLVVAAAAQVLAGDHEILSEHASRSLFLCYPPPNSNMALNCLKEYKGDCVV